MPPSEPLDRIQNSLIALVRRSVDPRANRRINEIAGTDIERSEATLVASLAQLGPIRMSALAEAVRLDISTVSRQISRLVSADLVERQTDPDDGRAYLLVLSGRGEDVSERLRQAKAAWITALLDDFSSDEQVALADLLERLTAAMHRYDQSVR